MFHKCCYGKILSDLQKNTPIFYDTVRQLIDKAVEMDSLFEIKIDNITPFFSTNMNINYVPQAYYAHENKTIFINAEQAYTNVLTYIVFELFNALNKDLQNISVKFSNFKDADHYAVTLEEKEFYGTEKPSAELIYKYLINHESEAIKLFYNDGEIYLIYLNRYKTLSEISFEEHLTFNKEHSELYRQQYTSFCNKNSNQIINEDHLVDSIAIPKDEENIDIIGDQ